MLVKNITLWLKDDLFMGAGKPGCYSASVMLSAVDGAPGEASQGPNTRPLGTICQSSGAAFRDKHAQRLEV